MSPLSFDNLAKSKTNITGQIFQDEIKKPHSSQTVKHAMTIPVSKGGNQFVVLNDSVDQMLNEASKTMQQPVLIATDSIEKEDISEQLLNEIEGYLSDVINNQEIIIDISETAIGNFGASFVAEAISECKGL